MKRTAVKTNVQTTSAKKQQIKVKEGARSSDEPYSVQLNGNNVGNVTKAPPWPTPQLKNEKMFILPKRLASQDIITIKCETASEPGQLRFGLVAGDDTPDYRNIACQLEMYFPPQYADKLAISTIVDGQPKVVHEESAEQNFEGSDFSMTFRIRDNGFMDIIIGQSILTTIQLIPNLQDIRFLTVNGDINKVLGLDFQFG